MPRISYKEKRFMPESLRRIELVNDIIQEYKASGYELTLRQVYYQLVARGFIENSEKSYKSIGNLISEARLSGLIDWNAIIDRTRSMRKNTHWTEPSSVIRSALYSYMLDRRIDQPNYVEVWVEKDALVGIVGSICEELDVPYFSCRGYCSQSEMWTASQRFNNMCDKESRTIIHLGDHDPSGIDMTRDIRDRLDQFGCDVNVKRVALTMKQIREFNPPPNPTKVTDTRAKDYIKKYGHECWELDALEPHVISDLILSEVKKLTSQSLVNVIKKREFSDKEILTAVSENYALIEDFLIDKGLA